MQSALICHELSKRFVGGEAGLVTRTWDWLRGRAPEAVSVVDRVSFSVDGGEIFGILGPNGSGKSTLIRMIATLLVPDGGSIRVFGHDVLEDLVCVRGLINRVSVDAALFKRLSAVENLAFTARLYGLPRAEIQERVVALLRRVGIEEGKLHAPIEEFSRGMQQKVSIARAFLTGPRLLLLDEPTTGLDPRSKRDVQAMILAMREDQGTTILLTTHDMEEAERLCDRVAILCRGRFVAVDRPEGLKALVPRPAARRTLEDVFLHLTGDVLVEANAPPNEVAA